MTEQHPHLPGNPYVEDVTLSDVMEGGPLRDALWAVAFELRTANLIAGGDSRDVVIRERLGLGERSTPPPPQRVR